MTRKQLFGYEYTRQRWLGRGVIVAAFRAAEYALQPTPF
jgi:hypothetical protein